MVLIINANQLMGEHGVVHDLHPNHSHLLRRAWYEAIPRNPMAQ